MLCALGWIAIFNLLRQICLLARGDLDRLENVASATYYALFVCTIALLCVSFWYTLAGGVYNLQMMLNGQMDSRIFQPISVGIALAGTLLVYADCQERNRRRRP